MVNQRYNFAMVSQSGYFSISSKVHTIPNLLCLLGKEVQNKRIDMTKTLRAILTIFLYFATTSIALVPRENVCQQQKITEYIERRRLFQQGLSFIAGNVGIGMVGGAFPITASAQQTLSQVAVLGANGKTGMEVVYALIKEGIVPISMTRTGLNPFERNRKLSDELKAKIVHYPDPVDVGSIESLQAALRKVKPQGIIFCASSSPSGGLPNQVDYLGVENSARVANEIGARFVLISALAVDRPESQSFQITNTLGGRLNGIMDAKRQGEESVRELMKDYVIVRPGVLLNGISRNGPKDIEINQGDYIGGGISRDELAAISVAALQSGKQRATIEAYRTNTRTKLQKEFSEFSGLEQHGNTYLDLFQSIRSD